MTTSGVACNTRPWAAHTVNLRRAWHYIIAFGKHTRSKDVRRGMLSSPLGSIPVERHRAWNEITALRQHERSGMSGAWYAIIALGWQTRSNDVGLGMPSPPLDSKHDRTTSGLKCHHRLWTAHSVERRRARHTIIAFEQHKRSSDVRRGMTSPPLDCTLDWTTSSVA
uniref:Uncharacterized protein n=1 Tax=Solanum lycopersicum TaxID=4081 RepID=A0A494G8J7_SOLLC